VREVLRILVVSTAVGAALWAANLESNKSVNPAQEILNGAAQKTEDVADVVVSSDAKKEL
jgi:hypothetical protein